MSQPELAQARGAVPPPGEEREDVEPTDRSRSAEPARMLEILAQQGFARPERWLAYAQQRAFRRVPAERLAGCPDCGSLRFGQLGQYVYYSNLITLRECAACALIYADTRIAPEVIQGHFEEAYKDEEYFLRRRRRIFEQLAQWVDRCAPRGGRLLDVGGATGELMAVLSRRRPDLEITVNDLSTAACQRTAERYGFRTICGGVAALEGTDAPFDVVVMSDVLYYEPEIGRLFRLLPRLVVPAGAVIIRVPNKLPLLRLEQRLRQRFAPRRAEMADSIPFFNPEHLFVFSRTFLERRLRAAGFGEVRVIPARMLVGQGAMGFLTSLGDRFVRAAYGVSRGRILASPSLLVVARRSGA